MRNQAIARLNWDETVDPSMFARRLRRRRSRTSARGEAQVSPGTGPTPSADEDWKRDEHWGAITAYLAHMYFPNEG